MFFLKKKSFGYQDYLYYLDYSFMPVNFFLKCLDYHITSITTLLFSQNPGLCAPGLAIPRKHCPFGAIFCHKRNVMRDGCNTVVHFQDFLAFSCIILQFSQGKTLESILGHLITAESRLEH